MHCQCGNMMVRRRPNSVVGECLGILDVGVVYGYVNVVVHQ